jgi:hypothetical protein
MKNQETIHNIEVTANPILERLGDRKVTSFQIKDLEIDNGVYLEGMPIRGKALNRVMSTLKVRNNFTEFSNKMSPEDWATVSKKLKTAEADTKLFAKIIKNSNDEEEVSYIFKENESKKVSDDASISQYFDWIKNSLSNSEKDYSLKSLNFDSKSEQFDLVLLNETDRVDVFGTDLDVWKMGDRFTFHGLHFNYAPFFERLICSNGNTAYQYGYGANITHAKFNNKRIQSVIEKHLMFGNERLPEQLSQAVQHLQNNNVSIAEFETFRKFFESRNENEKYDALLHRFFNDQPFYKGYGLNIAEKSRKWKSTANTGINAYDFFNMLTYIASHPEDVRMDREHRRELQLQASNILFKKELDLEDIANSVSIDYPRLAAMN